MATNTKLGIDPSVQPVDITLYRSMIGCLLYLTTSRSDISSSVDVCARFQANPKMTHLTVVKKIIKYVSGTCDFWFVLQQESNVSLVGYSDADQASNVDDRKNTTGGCYYVRTNLVAWISKKQNSFSLSTAEAKYITTGGCCSQLLWMKKLLGDYGLTQDTMIVYCDNSSAIDISKNLVQHSRTKHTEIRYHFIRDLVERKIVALEYTPTDHQNANIFTKPLDRSKFESLCQVICVITCLQSLFGYLWSLCLIFQSFVTKMFFIRIFFCITFMYFILGLFMIFFLTKNKFYYYYYYILFLYYTSSRV